jgi:hypothetical protein
VVDMLGSSASCSLEEQGAIPFPVDVVLTNSQIDDSDTDGKWVLQSR